MKKLPIVCFLSALFFCAIHIPANAEQVSDTAKSEPVIAKFYELPQQQWRAWQKIQQEWLKKEYPKILQAQKLKMTCSDCENIYLDAVFSIDATGKLTHYEPVNSKKCADKFSEQLVKKFVAWFFTIQFPSELYSLTFEVRLGTGLSC